MGCNIYLHELKMSRQQYQHTPFEPIVSIVGQLPVSSGKNLSHTIR